MPYNDFDSMLLDNPDQIDERINLFAESIAAQMGNVLLGPGRVHALVTLLNDCPYSNKFTNAEIDIALNGLGTIQMLAATSSDSRISRILYPVKDEFDSSADFDRFLSAVISLREITDDPNTINIDAIKVVLCGLRAIFFSSDEATISNILFPDHEEME